MEGIVYGEGGNLKTEARGRAIGSKVLIYFAKWLFDHFKAKCFFLNLTGAYMLRGMLKCGYKIEHTTYYDEFEYEGEKVFKDVKGGKIYNEPDRPGAYILAIYAEDMPEIVKILEETETSPTTKKEISENKVESLTV